MGEFTARALTPAGGGNGRSDGSLDSAVSAAQAFNQSWQQAITEIAGALMKEVAMLQAKLDAANSAVERIRQEREEALAAIRAAQGLGMYSNADNPNFQRPQDLGYSSDRPALSSDFG